MSASVNAAIPPPHAYRPDIDGLRAVAVLGVVLFHYGFGASGGYVGVDVFFVISGYLITGIIERDVNRRTFSLARFWERRTRRILPPLVVMNAVVLVLGYIVMLPDDLLGLGKSVLAQSVFSANIYFWRDVGYFAGEACSKPLIHTWSLSVEEQFYICLPFVLPWLVKRGRTRALLVLSLGAMVSLALSIIGTGKYPSATYYLLPTRAWELLAGACLALAQKNAIPTVSQSGLGIAGLAGILTSMCFYDSTTPFPGVAAVLPVAGAVAVIASCADGKSVTARWLSWKPLVGVGLISYPLYLWHWPLFVFCGYVFDAPLTYPARLLIFGVAIALSVCSYCFVENPIRHGKVLAAPKLLWFGTALCWTVLVLVAARFVLDDGVPSRVPTDLRYPQADRGPLTIDLIRQNKLIELGVKDGTAPRFLVWGDSHAGAILPLFDALATKHGIRGASAAKGGNPPIPNVDISWNPELREWNQAILNAAREMNMECVFLVARWSNYVEGPNKYEIEGGAPPEMSLVFDGDITSRNRANAAKLVEEGLVALCHDLCTDNRRVYIVCQPPEQLSNPYRRAFVSARLRGILTVPLEGVSQNQHATRQSRVMDCLSAARDAGAELILPSAALVDDKGMTRVLAGRRVLYSDQQHLSPDGVDLAFRDVIESALRSISPEPSPVESR